MLLNDENVVKKFQTSIFYRSRENHVSPKTRHMDMQTYGQMDISNYRIASLLKKNISFPPKYLLRTCPWVMAMKAKVKKI